MNTTQRRAWLGFALSLCALSVQAQDKTVVTLSRFFGACEADYGSVNDAAKARGECGIITSLVNQFNASNTLNVVVKPQIVEWGPYYDQLTARLVAKDVPAIAVMHESVLGDFVARKLVDPLDDGLKKVGVDTATYSGQARTGTTFDGKTYALPFDTWAWLWHVNLNLFKKAGLVDGAGAPVLPKTPDELLAQARKFKEATGKPYFAWTTANETAAPTRTFLTLVNQQGGQLFKGRTIDVKGKEAAAAMSLMNKLWAEGHIKKGLDYGATQQAFMNGDVGVNVVGTWTIDDFIVSSEKAGSPLKGGYTVVPFPALYGKKSAFADGHSWVLLKGGIKNDKQREGAYAFLKFLWDNDHHWARTGHLPANRAVLESDGFKALPFRKNILELSNTGAGMPGTVPRQRAVEQIIGEELSSMLLANKPVADVQAGIEQRVNKLLASAK
ncbi:extracellular solute-binding protein [Rhizobacter sp. Root1221]|uniref:extracellular solute-binding protein n=1 Tax=Rhizobacter sp. Root1221 TaxID=1736433 RepID=UPI0006F77E0B|nr:extracellular solute-binding protein [Rhizobacter sp. Root1221]KQV92765.1 ABC transporter substrate-binding protein [Rhizobacter sp. Root1221]